MESPKKSASSRTGQRLLRLFWRYALSIYRPFNRMSGGLISVFAESFREFHEDDGGTRAAAIAYYSFFSIFPLTVLVTLLFATVFGDTAARAQLFLVASRYLPTDPGLLDGVVVNVLQNRATVSSIALLGSLGGAVQIFRVLERAINRAWGAPRRRGFWHHAGFVLAMIVVAGGLTAASITVTILFELSQNRRLIVAQQSVESALLSGPVAVVTTFLVTFSLFFVLYRFVPHRVPARWQDIWPGALLAAIAWEGAKTGFTLYLSLFARRSFNQVYGSLGVIVALLTWVYVTGYIVLLGAEFCAVLSRTNAARAQRIAAGGVTSSEGMAERLD